MAKEIIRKVFRFGGIDVVRYNRNLSTYLELYEKFAGYTMIPKDQFVANLDLCSQFLDVPGTVIECGVWRGGMCAALAELSENKREFHLFDSFEGLPPAKEIDGLSAIHWQKNTSSTEYYDNCTADESFAMEAMKLANQKNYKVHKGWFDKTVPQYNDGPIGILRLDGDWYDSVKVCLEALFPKVVDGGIVIIDDYYTWDGCARAVHDYLSQHQISSRVRQWEGQVAYIIKGK